MNKILLIALLLASCANKESQTTAVQRIYQPKVLILAPSTTVKTVDGDYISNPIQREIWFSAQTVEDLEKQLGSFK